MTKLVVSLGADCLIGCKVRTLDIQSSHSPFEFIISPFHSLITCLRDDFSQFMQHIEHKWPTPGHEHHMVVIDHHYGFVSLHDFAVKPTEKECGKFNYKLKMYREAINSGHPILFTRNHLIIDHIPVLAETIRTAYPKLDFQIIGVSDDNTTYRDGRITLVPAADWNWSTPTENWKQLFESHNAQFGPSTDTL